jgi:hypothetical protein
MSSAVSLPRPDAHHPNADSPCRPETSLSSFAVHDAVHLGRCGPSVPRLRCWPRLPSRIERLQHGSLTLSLRPHHRQRPRSRGRACTAHVLSQCAMRGCPSFALHLQGSVVTLAFDTYSSVCSPHRVLSPTQSFIFVFSSLQSSPCARATRLFSCRTSFPGVRVPLVHALAPRPLPHLHHLDSEPHLV